MGLVLGFASRVVDPGAKFQPADGEIIAGSSFRGKTNRGLGNQSESQLIDSAANLRASLIVFTEATTGRIRVRPASVFKFRIRKRF